MKIKLPLFSVGLSVLFSTVVFSQNATRAEWIAMDNSITAELRKNGAKYETKRAIFWVERDGLTRAELEDFGKLVDRGMRDIAKYTGLKFDKKHFQAEKLEFFINSKPGISRGSVEGKPFIYLPLIRVKEKRAPYLHEAMHKLAYKSNQAFWMVEGFSTYIQTHLGTRSGGYNANIFNPKNADIHQLAGGHLKTDMGKKLLPLIGLNGAALRSNPEDFAKYRPVFEDRVVAAPAFYNMAESFVTFLVNKMGVKKVIRVFDSADMEANIFKLTGRKMIDWKADWMKSLNSPA